jgi:hypothetical protein
MSIRQQLNTKENRDALLRAYGLKDRREARPSTPARARLKKTAGRKRPVFGEVVTPESSIATPAKSLLSTQIPEASSTFTNLKWSHVF